ncbi:hypothetical protein LSPH26S_02232 [Lysinibacillus sphaericus]
MGIQTVKVPININDSATLLAVSTDITERKRYEDEIKFQANHDALTGLPNRRMFNEDLIALLEQEKLEGSQNAILFFDFLIVLNISMIHLDMMWLFY